MRVTLTNEAHQTETLARRDSSCPQGACSLSATFGPLSLDEKAFGDYTLSIEAADAVGNTSRTSRLITIDPAPPKLVLSGLLAERDGQPLGTDVAELTANAREADLPSSGIKALDFELDERSVARRQFNCATGCGEVNASFRFDTPRDGATRAAQKAGKLAGWTKASLAGVSCAPSATECQAVGYAKNGVGVSVPVAERWTGVSWQTETVPMPSGSVEAQLEGISCVTISNCTAVGYFFTNREFGKEAGSAFVSHWDGKFWTDTTLTNATGYARASLSGVSCASATDCMAVGKSAHTKVEEKLGAGPPVALSEHWNGTAWSAAAVSAPQLSGISCASVSFCVAVSGTETSSLKRWNGSSWANQAGAVPAGASLTLNGISCVSATACTAVGSYVSNHHTAPFAERLNGSVWSTQAVPDPVGISEGALASTFESVSCKTVTSCTAVGSLSGATDGTPLVEAWDSTDWAFEPGQAPTGLAVPGLKAVSCSAEFRCIAAGAAAGETEAVSESEAPGSTKTAHELTVEAVDKFGNSTSRTVTINSADELPSTPACNRAPTTVPPKSTRTATEATTAFEASVPAAVAASTSTTEELSGEEISPSYSSPKPNLESQDSLVEGETAVAPASGFTIRGVACISPTELTTAATAAKVVNGDAAVFANTAPEVSTAIRPAAGGTTVVQSIGGSSAPRKISWNVSLAPGESLVELPSGGAAITREMSEGGEDEVTQVPKPDKLESPGFLNDASVQLESSEYQVFQAKRASNREVVAVIPRPWLVLAQGSIEPLKIAVVPDKSIPTEYTMSYVYPPFELNYTPKSLILEADGGEGEAGASAVVNAYCPFEARLSPCGSFDRSAAAEYAENWGNPLHPRNPHYHEDYGSNNCTNFVSQILSRGGFSYMRAGETGDGSWWYRNTELDLPGERAVDSESWRDANVLPRHLWQYGLANIDPSQQPPGWTSGDIIAYNWFRDGKGEFNHLNYVVSTQAVGSGREPLIANESEPLDANYSHKPWFQVKERIEASEGSEWNRLALSIRNTTANWNEPGAKKHDPANLYGPNGFFQE